MPATPELQALLDRRFHLTHGRKPPQPGYGFAKFPGGLNPRGRLLTARNSSHGNHTLWPTFKRSMSVPAQLCRYLEYAPDAM